MEQLFRPEPLPYSHFQASTSAAGLPPTRILAAALASFQRAAERAGGALAAAPLRALLRREQVRLGTRPARQSRPCSCINNTIAPSSMHFCWALPIVGCAPPGAPFPVQVRHLEGVQRIASQNAVAAKLLAATSARVAADDDGAQPAAAFKAQFDFKTALASSNASFYPAIVLKH